MFRMRDGERHDDKVFAVLQHHPFFAEYRDYTDLPPHCLKEMEHFFAVYNDLDGSHMTLIGRAQMLRVNIFKWSIGHAGTSARRTL